MIFYGCLNQWSKEEQTDMWFFIGLALGYFVGKAVSALTQPVLDRVLVWDIDIFAWRVVPLDTTLSQGKRYLAAVEVTPQDFGDVLER